MLRGKKLVKKRQERDLFMLEDDLFKQSIYLYNKFI